MTKDAKTMLLRACPTACVFYDAEESRPEFRYLIYAVAPRNGVNLGEDGIYRVTGSWTSNLERDTTLYDEALGEWSATPEQAWESAWNYFSDQLLTRLSS